MAEATSLVRTVVPTNVQEPKTEFNCCALQYTVNKDGAKVKSIIVNGLKISATKIASIG
jgi:hypothetical protein